MANAMFVPFLCNVAGLPNSHLQIVRNWVNSQHNGMWQTMLQRTQFVHEYMLWNGSQTDRKWVYPASWNWMTQGRDKYISAKDQEWLLNIETNIPGLVFPPDCQHPELRGTYGQLLMQHFHDFQRRMG
jgi:hypothetical protein